MKFSALSELTGCCSLPRTISLTIASSVLPFLCLFLSLSVFPPLLSAFVVCLTFRISELYFSANRVLLPVAVVVVGLQSVAYEDREIQVHGIFGAVEVSSCHASASDASLAQLIGSFAWRNIISLLVTRSSPYLPASLFKVKSKIYRF